MPRTRCKWSEAPPGRWMLSRWILRLPGSDNYSSRVLVEAGGSSIHPRRLLQASTPFIDHSGPIILCGSCNWSNWVTPARPSVVNPRFHMTDVLIRPVFSSRHNSGVYSSYCSGGLVHPPSRISEGCWTHLSDGVDFYERSLRLRVKLTAQ